MGGRNQGPIGPPPLPHFDAPRWVHGTPVPHSGARHCNAPQWGHGTSMPHSGGTALQCPTVGARHFNAPQWGQGTSMPHSGRLARQCPTVGARHSNAVRVTVCTLVADKGELPLALSLSVGRCRGRGGVGVVPSGVGVAPSGVGVVPSGVGAVPSRSSWGGWAEIFAHHLQVPLQRIWDVSAVPHTPRVGSLPSPGSSVHGLPIPTRCDETKGLG